MGYTVDHFSEGRMLNRKVKEFIIFEEGERVSK